jgi:hypothetical protein
MKRLTRSPLVRCASVAVLSLAALVSGCGGAGGGGDGNWYYHWNCHGDPECRALGPGEPGEEEGGTHDMGPEYAMCSPLLRFAAQFWNMPPATNSCDHSPTDIADPPPPAITGLSPSGGAPGTSVTVTGTGFPTGASAVAVKVGGVPAVIASASATKLVIEIPASLGNGTYPIAVVTAGGTLLSTQTFTVVVPNPLGTASIKKIASGVDHACAILADDSVRCWGGNASGQLGNGTTASAAVAVAVTGIANAIDLAAGSSFTCAVVGAAPGATSGSVRCWGNGTSGQLGDGAGASSSTPVAAGAMSTATQVTARAGHACALLERGDVLCWGEGTSGQLGNGASESSAVPVAVIGTGPDLYEIVDVYGQPASTKAFQVSAGDQHTCARVSTSSGSAGLGVKCWGATNHGELGNGAPLCQAGVICDPKAPNPFPQRVGVITAAHLAAGGHHTCVALTSGAVRCWGEGTQGQLGNGVAAHQATPVNVGGVAAVTHVSSGSAFSCASAGGALKCWGANGGGQLGNGLAESSTTPVTVTAIGAGEYAPDTLRGGDVETCMKRSDATAFCFP